MEQLVTSDLKLGIIAGGQLAKMLIQEARKWDIVTHVLDNDADCPAGKIASHYVQGSHLDYDSVHQFGEMVDLLAFEIESVNVEALKKLKAEGHRIAPDPEVLALVQDKGRQKEFFQMNGISTPPFRLCESPTAILSAIEKGEISFPFVQKLRKGGYDGPGERRSDIPKLLSGPAIIEGKTGDIKSSDRKHRNHITCGHDKHF